MEFEYEEFYFEGMFIFVFKKFFIKWEIDIDCRLVFVNCSCCFFFVYMSDLLVWCEVVI